MPELPEVQTIVNELNDSILGLNIKSVRVLRESIISQPVEVFCHTIEARRIEAVSRKGKYIIFDLEDNLWMISHLRMTGKFIVDFEPSHSPYDRVLFDLSNGYTLLFQDVRCFGTLELCTDLTAHKSLMKLGWDPWDRSLTSISLEAKLKSRKLSVKSALLDQSVIAGLGNIYVSEILFDAAINPNTPVYKFTRIHFQKIIRSMRKILKLALKFNGTTISDYRRVDDKQGTFQNFLKVYGKTGELCPKCKHLIKRVVQNQRSTFYCESCQL